ncbi:unnamed protein product, partial [Anisakis simplex]|uniref:Phosphoenolpyruvate carboxylase n=1 Tax=Anisakis simplex TaxID=6269 RepID=A0A0M3JKZ0_ANISI
MSQELCTDEEKNKLIDRIVERILSLIDKSVRLDDKKTPKRGIYLARLTLINRLLETQLTLRTQLGTIKL